MQKVVTAVLGLTLATLVGVGIAFAFAQTRTALAGCRDGLTAVSARRGSVCADRPLSLVARAQLARAADAAVPAIEGQFGRAFERIPEIRVYATVSSFESALAHMGQDRGTRMRLGAFATAVMDAQTYRVLVNWERVQPGGLDGVLRHELTHAMLRDMGVAVGGVPIWFDEGLAMLAQGGTAMIAPDQAAYLLETSVPLDALATIEGWAVHSSAESYGVATAALTVLRERIGTEGLRQMYRSLASGRTFDTALFVAAGATLSEFAASLPDDLRRRGQ